ncbi:MAG: hypothetical protein KTR26_14405 [Flammeovirgaceae bacterium]|nr:hypothetical protein [Flammeovirgaceae bacterium]
MKNSKIMKNQLMNFKSIIAALIFSVALISCQNEGDNLSSDEVLDATAFSENAFNDLSYDIDDATVDIEFSNGRRGIGFKDCATRNIEEPEEGGYPKTITIEFGEDCTNPAGHSKSGKIIIILTGAKDEVGSQKIVEFEDFYVNDNKVEGKRTITYLGDYTYSIVMEGGKITTPEGEVITREANKERKMIEGMDTEIRSDNVFQITGTASGSAEGTSYSKEITTPLISSLNCPWIKSGVIETTIGETIATLDFGDGTCDNLAVRTVDGESEEIEMDFRIRRRVWKRLKK